MADEKTLGDRFDDAFYAVCKLLYRGYLKVAKKLKSEDDWRDYDG